METVLLKGKELKIDGNGFLVNPDAWDLDVANYFAAVEGIQMSAHHWEVVNFIREYYKQYRIAPPIKSLVKEMGVKFGMQKVNVKYLYQLYPCGPATQACKIAGLPRPTGCV